MKGYLRFSEIARKPKTAVYAVCSATHGDRLGTIRWYGPWRQYVFEPAPHTIWSDGCLREVEGFLAKLRQERAKA